MLPERTPGSAPRARATAAAVALLACAGPRYALVCPARGGAAWREVRTEHFAVVSARPPERARALALELEASRAAILGVWFRGSFDPPGRVRVVALGRAAIEELAPEGTRGWYGPDALGDAVAVVSDAPDAGGVVLHEVAHQLAATVYPRQPRWFAEGVAAYLGTLAIDGELAWIGRADEARVREAARFRVRAADLLAWGGEDEPGRYGRAWLLVHWLVNHRSKAFSGFQQRLARGEPPGAAWAKELPEYDPRVPGALARLDGELDAYLGGGAYATVRLPFERPPISVEERTLTAAEVHAVRLALPSPRRGAEAADRRAEVEEALREEPGHPVALLRRAEGQLQDVREALAREAVRTHPSWWQSWAFLARAVSPTARCQREAALRRATELAPGNAPVLNELAWALVEDGRGAEALPIAEQAARLEPWSPPVLDTYAAAAAAAGRCAEAVRAEERALELVSEGTAPLRDALAEKLARYRDGCGGARRAPALAPCPDTPPAAAAP